MAQQASLSKRLTFVLLSVGFLGASGPDAYGFHPCAHHGFLDSHSVHGHASSTGAASAGGEHSGSHESSVGHESAGETGHGHGSEGPCTCILHGQLPVDAPAPSSGPEASFDGGIAYRNAWFADADPRVLGPRHALFELHLPNAPPSST